MKAYLSKKELELILLARVKKFNSKITNMYLKEDSNNDNIIESSISDTDKILKSLIGDLEEIDELFKVQWSHWHFDVVKQN